MKEICESFNMAETALEDLHDVVMEGAVYPSLPAGNIKKAMEKIYEARADIMRQLKKR